MSLLKENLKSGSPSFGIAVTWAMPGIIEAVGGNYDFCWIDGQHGTWELRDIVEAVRTCEIVGTAALVRVADHSAGWIGQVLDLDPAGVIVPCVDNIEEALAVVRAACFPPIGNRSFGGRRVIDRHGRGYARDPDVLPLVIVQIETPTAVENLASIASVAGIDVLFFGPDDMKLRLGLAMDLPIYSPELASTARKIAETCKESGKYAMTVATTPEALEFALDAGFSIIVVGGDSGFIKKASLEVTNMVREARVKRVALR